MFKLAEMFVTVGADQAPLNHALAGIKAKLEGFAKGSFSVVGGGFAAALGIGAVGAATGIGLAIKAAGDMEVKIATLSKATDLEGAALAAMKAGLMGLSTELKGISLDALIDIATSGAKLGIATGELLAYTKGIAKVASAMDDIPAGEIADQVGKLNTVFKLGVRGTMQFGSAIDKLADSGVSSASGILNVAQRIAGSAVVAKISAQETVSLAAALLDTGTQAELASGALLDFIASLNQVKGRKEMAKTLGMSLADFATLVETRPMVAIEKFLGALAKLDAMGQVKTLENMGMKGDVHPAEMMKLAQVAGTLGKYVNMANHEFISLDQITKSYTATATLAWSQLDAFRNQVQIIADRVGGFLLPAFKRLTVGLAEAGAAFQRFLDANKPLFDAWGAVIESKVGTATSALVHWQEGLEVAREWTREKVTNIQEVFLNLLSNIPPLMDRITLAIEAGFRAGMEGAVKIVTAGMVMMARAMALAPNNQMAALAMMTGIPQAMRDATGVRVPGQFVPLKLSGNPKLATAQARLDAEKAKDDLARGAADRAANLAKAEAAWAQDPHNTAVPVPGLMTGMQNFKAFDPNSPEGKARTALAGRMLGKKDQEAADAATRARMVVPEGMPASQKLVPDRAASDQLKATQQTNKLMQELIKKTGMQGMVFTN